VITLPFPAIDPVMIHLGPWPVRWYGVAYAAGILLAWAYLTWIVRHYQSSFKPKILDDIMVPIILGIVIGGRLGFVLFYHTNHYLQYPWEILMVWQGGMAFHGGLLGATVAMIWFARKHGLPLLAITDVIATGTPIGLFLGRIANFINAEHYGTLTDAPWGVIFPGGGPLPRHPSQIYEALSEGLFLGLLLLAAWQCRHWRTKPGRITGLFLVGYALARMVCEFFRVPDGLISFAMVSITIGQFLSIPMLIGGLYLIYGNSSRSSTH
jgi:phosphatidylglycerol---prolipoprotein diacylglyceryl transferase